MQIYMFNFFFIQALEVKREIECPEVFIDDPHSGTTCRHGNYVHTCRRCRLPLSKEDLFKAVNETQ